MKFRNIDHIGLAVKNLKVADEFYGDLLGLEQTSEETVEEEGVKTAFYKIGQISLELLEPLRDDCAVAKHLKAKGEGVQHIAFKVENVKEAMEELEKKNVWIIDETPRKGSSGTSVFFLNPISTHGVLIELVEEAKE